MGVFSPVALFVVADGLDWGSFVPGILGIWGIFYWIPAFAGITGAAGSCVRRDGGGSGIRINGRLV